MLKFVAAAVLAAGGPAVAQAQPVGQALYNDNCAACHQRTGLGLKGAFPALAGDKLALGPVPAAATVLLMGRGGMPAFRNELNDAELAAILTYIRTNWGNKGAVVTSAQVAAVRARATATPKPRGLQAH